MQNVLIADDNRQIADVLKQYIEDDGFSAHVVYDGEKALELFEKKNFSMVMSV